LRLRLLEHPTDDTLEGYARNNLDQSARDDVEDHLLVCEGCRQRLEIHEAYLRAMREALRKLEEG